jgi:hypothetical protein
MVIKRCAQIYGRHGIAQMDGLQAIPDPLDLSSFNGGGGGGGSGIPLFTKKTTFPYFCYFLSVSPCLRPRPILGKRRRILKIREIFFSARDEVQKPLSVFATELQAERIEDIFEAHFSRFSIFRYSPDLAGAVTANWGRIWRNRRTFLSIICSYTITSFSFHLGFIFQEKNTSVQTPLSQKTGLSFMAESSIFCGSGGYFWPRRLNRLPKLIRMIYPIYLEDFNVKGFDL